MKRFSLFLSIALCLVFINISCDPDPVEEFGSIYGIVTDKATGEPVKNANVQLRPSGETSLTGTDGRYEFLDLKAGDYSITVSKTGYTDLIDDYVITLDGAKAMRRDVQIEILPAELRIIDNDGNDINELNFGSIQDVTSQMFNIFNSSTSTLEYEILKTASWIMTINNAQGNIQPGATKPVVVNIDRDKLSSGLNQTFISIMTNNGGKQLVVKATNSDGGDDNGGDDNGGDDNGGDDNGGDDIIVVKPTVTTKDVTSVTANTALSGGTVTSDGGATVIARGVCWSTSQSPTINNNKTVDGSGTGSFTSNLSNLAPQTTYYVRAYATNSAGTSYGVTKIFITEQDETGNNINGHEYVDLGLPSGLKWATRNVGANSAEMAGSYYSWGELETKDYYGTDDCTTYGEMSDISGNPDYDVARAQWGSSWRMPKKSEVNELYNNCTMTTIEVNGKKCVKFTGSNGNSIIVPCSGFYHGDSNGYYNDYGRYWTSTPAYGEYDANYFSTSGSGIHTASRSGGYSIRPVSN
ncbi:MAG: carboxypeptidase regulatory-like domain-containing protein [Bacteroidales bacterium]|nr:carboxypeptidase regulatory-like domain-containing protein [Bacteroidales bacterium]